MLAMRCSPEPAPHERYARCCWAAACALVAALWFTGCGPRVTAPDFHAPEREQLTTRIDSLGTQTSTLVRWVDTAIGEVTRWPAEYELDVGGVALARFVWMSCLVYEVRVAEGDEERSFEDGSLLAAPADTTSSALRERGNTGGFRPCSYERADEYSQLVDATDDATSAWLVRRVYQIDALRLNLRSVVPGRLDALRNERVFAGNQLAGFRDALNEEMLEARASNANPVRVRAWEEQVDAALEELAALETTLEGIDDELTRISGSRRDVIAEVARRLASGSPGAVDFAPIFRRVGE